MMSILTGNLNILIHYVYYAMYFNKNSRIIESGFRGKTQEYLRVILTTLSRITRLKSVLCNSYKKETVYFISCTSGFISFFSR